MASNQHTNELRNEAVDKLNSLIQMVRSGNINQKALLLGLIAIKDRI